MPYWEVQETYDGVAHSVDNSQCKAYTATVRISLEALPGFDEFENADHMDLWLKDYEPSEKGWKQGRM